LPIVLRPYKFSKSRPIKYRILAISRQKYAVKYRLLVINHQIVRIFEFIKYYWQHWWWDRTVSIGGYGAITVN
jgi:hypothetical protein